jgi:hypothetical protein
MARIESENSVNGYRFEASVANISGLSRLDVEQRLAEQSGIPCPDAGIPDEKAIEGVFGFSRQDIYRDKTRISYKGVERNTKANSLEFGAFGEHDLSGADSS